MTSVRKALIFAGLVVYLQGANEARAEEIEAQSIPELMRIVGAADDGAGGLARLDALVKVGHFGTAEAATVLIGLINRNHTNQLRKALDLESNEALPEFLYQPEVEIAAAIGLSYIAEKKALPVLIAGFMSQNPMVRVHLSEGIGRIGGGRAIKHLYRVAKTDKSDAVRKAAVWAMRHELFNNPAGLGIPGLFRILKIESLRPDALHLLAQVDDARAAKKIIRGLISTSPDIRGATCDLLQKVQHKAATDRLIAFARQEPDRLVRGKALIALTQIVPSGQRDKLTGLLTEAFQEQKRAVEMMETIEDALSEYAHSRRSLAQVNVKRLQVLVPFLLKAAADEEPELRRIAVKVLQYVPLPAVRAALKDRIKQEEDLYTRRASLTALGVTAESEGDVQFLLDWYQRRQDDQPTVVEALAKVTSSRASSTLIAALRIRDAYLREAAVRALRQAGSHAAARALLRMLSDERGEAAERAADALAELAGRSLLDSIATAIRDGAPTQLTHSYIRIDRRNRFAHTRRLLKRSSEADRLVLAEILNNWQAHPGDESVLGMVAALPDAWPRAAAARILSDIDSHEARTTLCRMLRRDKDSNVREVAARSLGNHVYRQSITCLVQAFSAADRTDVNLRERVLRALNEVTGKRFDTVEEWQAWQKSGLGVGKTLADRVRGLRDADDEVKILAAHDIAKWADEELRKSALVALHQRMQTARPRPLQLALVKALASIGDRSSANVVSVLLRDRIELPLRTAIAGLMFQADDARGVISLQQLLANNEANMNRVDEFAVMEALAISTGSPLHYDKEKWLSDSFW